MKLAPDASTRLEDPDARRDARVGRTVLGQYEVVRVVGQGGMGTVYEARHTRLGRRVAVKFVRAGTVASAKLLARFEQEALSAGALESEHIPTVIGLVAAPDSRCGGTGACASGCAPARGTSVVGSADLGGGVASTPGGVGSAAKLRSATAPPPAPSDGGARRCGARRPQREPTIRSSEPLPMSRPVTATVGVRLAWAVGLGAILATGVARGDKQRHEARAHFDRAVVLLEQRKYPAALEELEAAYALHPHPAVLYNIGMAHFAMDNPVAAARSLERYLSEAGSSITPERRAETLRVLDELAPRLATLVLDVEPRGARVTLNGVVVVAVEPITLAAGKHELVVTHAGHRTDRRSLELKGRTVTSLQIRLGPGEAASRERVHLDIDCPVPDATVYLDDVAVARTPLSSMLISPGPHRVEFRRTGYAAAPRCT